MDKLGLEITSEMLDERPYYRLTVLISDGNKGPQYWVDPEKGYGIVRENLSGEVKTSKQNIDLTQYDTRVDMGFDSDSGIWHPVYIHAPRYLHIPTYYCTREESDKVLTGERDIEIFVENESEYHMDEFQFNKGLPDEIFNPPLESFGNRIHLDNRITGEKGFKNYS